MGFLAMSCQAMGFSTLMTNLLHCYPMSQTRQAHSKEDLETEILDLYNAGFGAKLRVHRMSSFYNDMTFQEAAKHSYTNLDLLLIGLFKRPSFTAHLPGAFAGSGDFVINPSGHARISANHLGIFVANEIAIVERAWLFCKDCHAGIKSAIEVKACGCASQKTDALARPEVDPVRKFWQQSQQIRRSDSSALDSEFPIGKHNNSVRYSKVSLPYMDNEANVARQGSPVISAMGRYHQAPIRTVTEALIANVEGDYRRLASHIVVCILAEEGAPSLCLQELIAPLRSSSIPYSSLRDVILFGNVKFIEAEWNSLAQFPKVHVVQGNATEWKHLELASIRTCSVCVVLSSKNNRSLNDVSDDQRAVLATLNLRSVECGFRVANLTGERRGNNSHLDIVTSMDHDENVRFLEHGDPADTSAVAQTRSYMAGEILVNSFVESLTISTYFNPLAMPLIESFIYGHSHFAQRADHPDIPGNAKEYLRQSCLNLIRIGDGVLAGILSGEPYCDVVTHALEHGAVCLGLFRRFPDPVDEDQADPTVTRRRRCVITAPPRETLVQSDDLVFVFTSTVQKRPSNVITHKIQLVDYNGLHEREFSEGRLAAQDDWDKIPPSQRFERLMDDMKEDLLKHRASLQAANQKFLQSPYKNAKK
ncbi:putative Potassium channel subfamily U member 1 [Hypsibius exemplaris]|uniref:Potassium channel subfamily U member 1 n=1 Tax=Hypsibius exemplaris TaxID=2072580 RepID=A0A1W0X293_HYPEX|nr:putative Potassium channel subfamily U member 1 [Hypsibius exemplaris]